METAPRHTQAGTRRVSTPSFPDCARMDAFYAAAHRLIEEKFDAERKRRGRGSFSAGYVVEADGADVVVTLLLRARENGRIVSRKAVVHRWRDGYIAPRRRALFNIISNIRKKHKGKSEKASANGGAAKNY